MSSPVAPRDVTSLLRRRWALAAVAVGAAVVAALLTMVAAGDVDDIVAPLLVAAVGGLVLGVGAMLVVDSLDGTIRSPRDLVRLTGAPNLAVVLRHQTGTPRPDDVTMFRDPNSIEAEGYRSLRTALEFVLWPPETRGPSRADSEPSGGVEGEADAAIDGDVSGGGVDHPIWPRGDGPGKIVLVTSARPGEGKSSVAANLAAACAMAGRRVVLVDGDLRKPQVHRLFRLPNHVGLSSMLTGEVKGFAAVQRLDATKHLLVVSGGPPPPDPAELLAGPRLAVGLSSMASQADLVVVDAPPVMAVTDPTLIAQHSDATIMVAISDESDRREWAEALRRLALVDAEVIGTVLMQPDDRANVNPTYQYTPSAVPKNWWVGDERPGTVDDANVGIPDEAMHEHTEVFTATTDEPAAPVDPLSDVWPDRRPAPVQHSPGERRDD